MNLQAELEFIKSDRAIRNGMEKRDRGNEKAAFDV